MHITSTTNLDLKLLDNVHVSPVYHKYYLQGIVSIPGSNCSHL